MLEAADARDGVERPEALAGHLPSVVEVNVEAMPLARRDLRRGQGDTDPRRALVADEFSSGPHPQPRSSTRRLAPIPTWSAMYSCLRR